MNPGDGIATFQIGPHSIGPQHPCLIIGEIAQAHDGSLGMAHAYVDAVADAGADAVKFQTHIAAAESTAYEPWRARFSYQDETRYAYWQRMEFAEAQWAGLAAHARERGLLFLSSPFSIQAVELLHRLEMPAWKIASGEVSSLPMLEHIARMGQPVLLSSGMSDLAEIDRAVAYLKERDVPFMVFQCTTAYPCPPEKIGLNMLSVLKERYRCPVGLSDHSGTIYPGLAGVTLGMQALEVHVTLSREMFGPDVPASITTSELRQLVEGVRFVERMIAHPVDKDSVAEEMAPLRDLFNKSVVAARDLKAGTILEQPMLSIKKPGGGMPAARLNDLLGKRLLRDVAADQQLAEQDVEDA